MRISAHLSTALCAALLTAACMPDTEETGPPTEAASTELPASVVQTGTNEDLSPAYVLSFTTPGGGAGLPNAPVMDSAAQDQTMRNVCPGGYEERFRGPVGDTSEVRVGFFCK